MNRHRTSLFTLITLITLVISPAVVAEIYKCDGPDGPIYSDKKCGSDATNVELTQSSGLSGVSEKDKEALAEKKLEREQEREQARKQAQSQNQQSTAVNNQNNAYTTEDPGYWARDGDRLRNLDKEKILPGKTQPTTPPTEPRPVTLPANLKPVIPPKKRDGG
jgi:hypothetical protein